MTVTEQPGRNGHWDKIRERIVADFRDFRFTWWGFLKWTLTTIIAFLIAALVTLYFLDWNQLRGPISRYLSEKTGREVRLDGNLAVKLFTWQPSVDAQQVYVGNPKWVGTPQAAKVGEFRIETRLVPLIFGQIVLPLVKIDNSQFLLERDESGRTNWDGTSAKTGGDAWKLPPIQRFVVHNGHVEIHDAVRSLRFTGTISSQEDVAGGKSAFTLLGDGTLNKSKFTANVNGGPLLNIKKTEPYNFTADIHAGETHVQMNGSVTEPFHLDRYTASLKVNGPTMADLYYMTGLVLPHTPPYHMSLQVARDGAQYRITDINAMMGGTDLEGNLTVDVSGTVPALAGKVASRVLVFEDLSSLVGGAKDPQAVKSKFLLPETPLHTERLKQTNAEVDYSARSIKSRDFPLTSLDTHVSLEHAVLELKPLAFGFAQQGKLSGSLKVDGRKAVPVVSVDARLTDIKAESFIKGSDKPIQGTLEARAVLTGTGNNVHAAASTADGRFTAVVPNGGMRHSLAEWAGVDVLKALSLSLEDDKSNTQLRCAVANFGIQKGVLTSQQMVLDTEPVRIDGSGTINLADETVDMRLQGAPKHFQFFRVRAPITFRGPLVHPKLGIDPGPAIAQGGAALALGFINPVASIIAFIDPGLTKDANCGPLLQDAKAKGAPVKASVVKNAPAPRK